MTIFTLIAYRPSHDDYCQGASSSDLEINEHSNIETLAKALVKYEHDPRNNDQDYAKWQLTLLVDGHQVLQDCTLRQEIDLAKQAAADAKQLAEQKQLNELSQKFSWNKLDLSLAIKTLKDKGYVLVQKYEQANELCNFVNVLHFYQINEVILLLEESPEQSEGFVNNIQLLAKFDSSLGQQLTKITIDHRLCLYSQTDDSGLFSAMYSPRHGLNLLLEAVDKLSLLASHEPGLVKYWSEAYGQFDYLTKSALV